MQIAVVWNARAGSAASSSRDAVEARLAELGAVTMFEVTDELDPPACARAALASGADIVVAAGGDGTVSAVATELVGATARLGVLPLGTSNSFAAALDVPADLAGALDTIAAGNQRVIDVATVRGPSAQRVMILHCMVGFHADAIGGTSVEAKRRWGVLAYAGSALRELATLSPFAVELATDEQVVRCRAIAVAIANLAPVKTVLAHGPSHLLGDDGRVDITVVAAETIAEAIATGLHLYRSARSGDAANRDNVGSCSAVRVTITTSPVQSVLVDGEPFGETPVTIQTIPRALTVIAPPPTAADGPPLEAPLFGLPDLEIDGTPMPDDR